MPFQIALAWSDECERELLAKGFKKREVYVRDFYGECSTNSDVACKAGDSDFFRMKYPPFQFITTSYWGAGFE